MLWEMELIAAFKTVVRINLWRRNQTYRAAVLQLAVHKRNLGCTFQKIVVLTARKWRVRVISTSAAKRAGSRRCVLKPIRSCSVPDFLEKKEWRDLRAEQLWQCYVENGALTERQGMCARRNGPCGAFFMYTSEHAHHLPRIGPKTGLDLVKNRRRVHLFFLFLPKLVKTWAPYTRKVLVGLAVARRKTARKHEAHGLLAPTSTEWL